MKKLLSFLFVFLLTFSSLSDVNAALSTLKWSNGQSQLTIENGQAAIFDFTSFTINPPLKIKIDLLNINDVILKTYEDRTLNSNLGSFGSSYTIQARDYGNNAGDYRIKAYVSDNINEFQIRYIDLKVQPTQQQDTTPPSVSVSHSPSNPSTLDQVTITATASDASGLSEIKIYVDGSNVKTCNTGTISQCSTTSQTYSAGAHTYYATAKDNSNNNGRDPLTGTKTFTVTSIILQDTTAPAAITNLQTSSPTPSSITLTWTAPGDDGSTGTAATYIVRYNTAAITNTNWGTSTDVTNEPAPQIAGSLQTMTISGLSPSTTYYFAIKAQDEVPNTASLSNIPTGTTTDILQDTTPPSVSVSHSPSNPSTLDQVTITATASDASGLSEIKIYVDGSNVKTCNTGTISQCSTTSQTYSAGAHTYYATAKDNSNNNGRDPLTGTKTFTVSTPTTSNQPPILQSIGDKQVSENDRLQFIITATDSENDQLTLAGINLPQNSTLVQTGNTAKFSWIPSYDMVQHPLLEKNFQVTFKVFEISNPDNSDIESITIKVLDYNRNPTINPINDISVNEGSLVSITANANDLDSDILNYSINDQRFTKSNNVFTWQTRTGDSGVYNFIIYALDSFGGTVSSIAKVIVNTIQIMNHNPEITSVPITTTRINTAYRYDVEAIDIDNDALTYSLNIAPTGMVINPSTGLITWTSGQVGSYGVEIKVSDGNNGNAIQSYLIDVVQNLPPEANAGPDKTVSPKAQITFDGSQSLDSDGFKIGRASCRERV